MATTWYVKHDGKTYGPMSASKLYQLAADGRIQSTTLVRPSDRDRWYPAGKVRGLLNPPQALPQGHIPDPPTKQPPQTRPERLKPLDFEFTSTDVHFVTSDKLASLKTSLSMRILRRNVLLDQKQGHSRLIRRIDRKLWWLGLIPFSRSLLNAKITTLEVTRTKSKSAVKALERDIRSYAIRLKVRFDTELSLAYNRLSTAFSTLQACKKTWDVAGGVHVDRYAERTTATAAIERYPTQIRLGQFEILECDYQAFHFTNVNGADLFLYPTFTVVAHDEKEFGLVAYDDLRLTYRDSRFIEEESVPEDTEVIGHTWKKANKDGTRDKRFKDNYQIPIVHYGDLQFESSGGMNEVYSFSNADAARGFLEAFDQYQSAVQQK